MIGTTWLYVVAPQAREPTNRGHSSYAVGLLSGSGYSTTLSAVPCTCMTGIVFTVPDASSCVRYAPSVVDQRLAATGAIAAMASDASIDRAYDMKPPLESPVAKTRVLSILA